MISKLDGNRRQVTINLMKAKVSQIGFDSVKRDFEKW